MKIIFIIREDILFLISSALKFVLDVFLYTGVMFGLFHMFLFWANFNMPFYLMYAIGG